MSMLIPFWVWMILGAVLALWIRAILVKRFGFLNRFKKFGQKPKKPRKRRKRPPGPQSASQDKEVEEDEEDEEMSGTERIKSAAKKGMGVLAKPWEYLLGGPDDEEDEDE